MFGKKKHFSGNSPDTIIGDKTICEGKIMTEASLRIDGQLQADIDCAEDVTIGERGQAHSHITARNVIVAGKVRGEVIAKERLFVARTGELIGNISARSLIIEEGGVFQGACLMVQEGESEERMHPKLVSSKSSPKPAHKPENKAAGAN